MELTLVAVEVVEGERKRYAEQKIDWPVIPCVGDLIGIYGGGLPDPVKSVWHLPFEDPLRLK